MHGQSPNYWGYKSKTYKKTSVYQRHLSSKFQLVRYKRSRQIHKTNRGSAYHISTPKSNQFLGIEIKQKTKTKMKKIDVKVDIKL